MRAPNSVVRSPAKTRWVWLSTQPGTTARPSTSTRESAAGASAAGPTQVTRSPSITSAASVSLPSAPSLVVNSAMPVTTTEDLLAGSRVNSAATAPPSRPPAEALPRLASHDGPGWRQPSLRLLPCPHRTNWPQAELVPVGYPPFVLNPAESPPDRPARRRRSGRRRANRGRHARRRLRRQAAPRG